MGSTIDNIKCPKCSFKEATTELYYKTGEEIIFCPRCGYNLEHNVYRKAKAKASGGKGIIYVGFEGGGTLGQFQPRQLKYLQSELKKDNVKNGNGESPREVYYTKKIKGKWQKNMEKLLCGIFIKDIQVT